MLQYVAFGVIDGAFLLLATLGFAIVRRINKFLNIAHAEYMAVSAFTTWGLATVGIPFIIAALTAVVFVSLLGLGIGRFVFERLLSRGSETLLIVSVGVAFAIDGAIEGIVSPGIKSFPIPRPATWTLGSARIDAYQAAVVVMAFVVMLATYVFLSHTTTGASMRAIADNRQLAEVRGLNVRRVTGYVWLATSALAGLAGVALGLIGTLTTDIAFAQILLIIAVSILAGLGSVYGVALAAIVIGLAMDMSIVIIPSGYKSAVAFAIVIVLLFFRPQGFFGKR